MKKLQFLLATFIAISLTINLNAQKVDLAGPRFGVTYITGDIADKLDERFNAKPLITQFGWQFETKFFTLSQSGITGLVEGVVLVGGIEQGKVFPSLSGLIGFRGSNGVEFGFGPNLSLSGLAMAYAIGVTFTIEHVNFPINFAIVPSPEGGVRYSILLGFNSSRY